MVGTDCWGAAVRKVARPGRHSGPPAADHGRQLHRSCGADRTIWRLHAAYDPAAASFTDLELTGADAGEGFGRFTFSKGDLAVGDRGYAKPPGLQHVLTAGADFLVRVGWNSLRMTSPDRARASICPACMAPYHQARSSTFPLS